MNSDEEDGGWIGAKVTMGFNAPDDAAWLIGIPPPRGEKGRVPPAFNSVEVLGASTSWKANPKAPGLLIVTAELLPALLILPSGPNEDAAALPR
jgi:hypothetical protein